MTENASNVLRLAQNLGLRWENLQRAKAEAEAKRAQIEAKLLDIDSEDTSIVVSGSLARDEFTSGSDLDWTLLIDGLADPKHHALVRKIRTLLQALVMKAPGREGTFGDMVFSHDLIHQIGGEDDTNRNTTRRLLLLLESRVVGRSDAYTRVVRHILSRYLLEDRGLWRGSGPRVPRFLQNDFARYWRTMAVDFAYKLRNRSGEGWAIRNIKLRMSRKLTYVSGLLACFRCELDFSEEEKLGVFGDPNRHEELIRHLEQIFQMTPLEIVAEVLSRYQHLKPTAAKIFNSYDGFIGILADSEKRQHLEALKEEEAEFDTVYQAARELSHQFRDGIVEFFFDPKSPMEMLTKNYGVF